MTIGTFFDQNGAAIIIAGFGAVPATVNIILTWISNQRATKNMQVTLENRKIAISGRVGTDAKIANVQEAVENGYHTAVAVAADAAATKVVEKAKEVAAVLAGTAVYTGPERREEDKGPPDGIEERRLP